MVGGVESRCATTKGRSKNWSKLKLDASIMIKQRFETNVKASNEPTIACVTTTSGEAKKEVVA